MTNFSGENLNAACGGMDSRRNGVAEVSTKYLVEAAKTAVPAGYKQTEVGMIPEDWDCLDFADMFTCRQGMQVPVEKQSLVESTHTVRFIRIIDLTDQQEPPRYISNPGDKYLVKKYDLFMVRYGVPGLIGFNYEGVIANNLFRIIPKMSCFTAFYAHYLSYRHKDILDSSGSSTMPAISFSTLARFKIIKPLSEKEQTAIANALSDVDALISELEKLIAKKQAIKTATMQQLLTGRTRLPQFALREDGTPKGTKPSELGEIPEDWDCLDFADMFTCRQGMQVPVEKQSLVESTHTVRFIRIIDLTDQQEPPRYISNPGDKYLVKKYDLFMVRYGVPGLIGFNYEGVIANNLFRIIPRMSCFTAFYAHYLSYRHKDILDSSGSSTMPAISFSTLARFKIIKPLSEKEQTAIATILSDMDAEIHALEQRLGKTRQIKQGMMQELLTGKTRLIKPSKEVIHE